MQSFDLSTIAARANLPIRAKPYWHCVEFNRHLGLRVRMEHSWVARCRTPDGSYRQCTLARATPATDGIDFAAAQELAETWFADQRARRYAQPPYIVRYNGQLIFSPVGAEITVGSILHHYVTWKRLAAAHTHFHTVISLINHHIVPRLASLPIAAFDAAVFHAFCLDVLETAPKRGVQRQGPRRNVADLDMEALRKRKKTLNALISILRGAFQLAADNEQLPSDRPLRLLRQLPNYDRPRLLVLNRRDCQQLIKAADPALQKLITAALYTGCRAGELRALRVQDVLLGEGCLYIAAPKNYQPRRVYLPEDGCRFFRALIRGKHDGDLVFLNASGRQWGDQYRYRFKLAVDRAGLAPQTVFHTLRHTYASQLIQGGAQMHVVARQLGHADIKTVFQTYGHLMPSTIREDINAAFKPINSSDDDGAPEPAPSPSAWPFANQARYSGPFTALGKPVGR